MPGTATISSGYTSMLQSRASTCDRDRLLARLQNMRPSLPSVKSNSSAPSSSILEEEASLGCSNYFGNKATTSGVHILSVQNKLINSPCNSFNTSCGAYTRLFPAPCPIQTPKNPIVISKSQCQPSRFF